MERVKSLKELADLGLIIGRRFYGQYPEISRTYYKPPQQGDSADSPADGSQANCEVGDQHGAPRPTPTLPRRSSAPSLLLVRGLSSNYSDWIPNGETHARSGYFSEGESILMELGTTHWIYLKSTEGGRSILAKNEMGAQRMNNEVGMQSSHPDESCSGLI